MPIKYETKPNEGSSSRIDFQFEDYDQSAIALADFTAATFSLRDEDTTSVDDADIINSRDASDILSSLEEVDGTIRFYLLPADNTILDTTKKEETHIAHFKFTAVSGGVTFTLHEEAYITVENLNYDS